MMPPQVWLCIQDLLGGLRFRHFRKRLTLQSPARIGMLVVLAKL